MNRHDPRIRQTINRLTDTLETANLNTQASLWTFSEAYVQPCLKSVSTCFEASCYPCIGAQRERIRSRQRQLARGGARGRPEFVFDFYNDEWDEEETERTGLLGRWGTDELDRLLAGSGSEQPRRHGQMNYGSRGVKARRKSIGAKGGEADPTILPGSSMFGFLERLPWKIGGRGVRYKPSAADLQDNPGRKRAEAIEEEEEGEPLLESDDGLDADEYRSRHQRKRSETIGSHGTSNSFSSRGDLFPSDDEDDAVPLDDEFAMMLGRRNTDDMESGKSRSKRHPGSRTTSSSKETPSIKSARSKRSRNNKDPFSPSSRNASHGDSAVQMLGEDGLPTIEDLKQEEARVREEEDAEVERKRLEARQVAIQRGLVIEEDYDEDPQPISDDDMQVAEEEEGQRQGENIWQAPTSPEITNSDYNSSLKSPDSTKSFGDAP